MEKRVTLAIVLCVLVFLVWQHWLGPRPAPRRPERPPARPAPTRPAPRPEPAAAPRPSGGRPTAPERLLTVDTAVARWTLTNHGAAVRSCRLHRYYDLPGLTEAARREPRHWLAVLRPFAAENLSLVLRVKHPDLAGRDLGREAWELVRPPREGEAVAEVAYRCVLPDGTRIMKTFRFPRDRYAVELELTVVPGGKAREMRFELVGPGGILKEKDRYFRQFAAVDQGPYRAPVVRLVDDHVRREGPVRLAVTEGPIRYVAASDKYFLALLALPAERTWKLQEAYTSVVLDRAGLQREAARTGVTADRLRPGFYRPAAGVVYRLRPAAEGPFRARFVLYAGPRSRRELARAGLEPLTGILDVESYQMCGLGWLVRPVSFVCQVLLRFFHGIVGNYGLAILLLTLLVRLCMFPLTRKQMLSMQRYQAQIAKIKPDLERLQKKYQGNPRKRQQELMKLYKAHNIHPVPWAGCLPLLVNIPVFFGLFHALRSAMELRHAPFMLWIRDLSAPDALVTFSRPLHVFCFTLDGVNVLPLLMGLTWFLQMATAPRPADPQAAQQQKMMMFMPLFFTFMLYNYAAGLSLYWTCNSLLAMIEQRFIRRALPAAHGAR